MSRFDALLIAAFALAFVGLALAETRAYLESRRMDEQLRQDFRELEERLDCPRLGERDRPVNHRQRR